MNSPRVTLVHRSMLLGLACAVPFVLLNAVVAQRLEPLFSLVRPGEHTGPLEYPLLIAVLLLLPIGALLALAPAWRPADGGHRSVPVLNLLVATLLLAGFVVIASALGSEIYACDVARVPSCD